MVKNIVTVKNQKNFHQVRDEIPFPLPLNVFIRYVFATENK